MLRRVWGWTKILVAFALGLRLAFWAADLAGAGAVTLTWADWSVTAPLWAFVVGVGLFTLALFALYALTFWLLSIPAALRRQRERAGHDALARGLAAVAAGDTKRAQRLSARAAKRLPESHPLALLLSAQAARLSGDADAARATFTALLEDKGPGRSFGLRGLVQDALSQGREAEALALARQAAEAGPKKGGWAPRLLYDLLLRNAAWDEAYAMAGKVLPPREATEDRRAMDLLLAKGEAKPMARLKRALGVDPAFAPAACALAAQHLREGRPRAAARVVERAWAAAPHPDLVPLWEASAPPGRAGAPVRWAERLAAHAPDSAESHLLRAGGAERAGLWGQARAHLDAAAEAEPTARVYAARAGLEAAAGAEAEAVEVWRAKAASAPKAKAWVCRATGRAHAQWVPVTDGGFNTLAWATPGAPAAPAALMALPELEVEG
jgi:HemY protein